MTTQTKRKGRKTYTSSGYPQTPVDIASNVFYSLIETYFYQKTPYLLNEIRGVFIASSALDAHGTSPGNQFHYSSQSGQEPNEDEEPADERQQSDKPQSYDTDQHGSPVDL